MVFRDGLEGGTFWKLHSRGGGAIEAVEQKALPFSEVVVPHGLGAKGRRVTKKFVEEEEHLEFNAAGILPPIVEGVDPVIRPDGAVVFFDEAVEKASNGIVVPAELLFQLFHKRPEFPSESGDRLTSRRVRVKAASMAFGRGSRANQAPLGRSFRRLQNFPGR